MPPSGLNTIIALLTINIILCILVLIYQVLLWNAREKLKMLGVNYQSFDRWSKKRKIPKQTIAKNTISKMLVKSIGNGTPIKSCLIPLNKALSIRDLITKVIKIAVINFSHFINSIHKNMGGK